MGGPPDHRHTHREPLVRYRLTLECGPSALVDDVAARHFLRQAVRRGHETTRVRGGHVVTLPAGERRTSLVALIAEAPPVDLRNYPSTGVVSRNPTMS
jgi:hypothetical protein